MINFEFNVEEFKEELNNLTNFGLDYLEAIIVLCDKRDIELETIFPIIKKDQEMKAKLADAATKKNFLKK
jgi:hypothetical protein